METTQLYNEVQKLLYTILKRSSSRRTREDLKHWILRGDNLMIYFIAGLIVYHEISE